MSFDIFLQYVEREPPLDPANANAKVADVVRRFGGPDRSEFGYFFDLQDGGHAELYAGGAEPNAMFALRRITPQLCALIREIMAATGWVAIVPNEEIEIASLRDLPRASLLDEVPPLTLIQTDEDLMRLLSPGFSTWAAYRDQIVKGN